MKPQNTAIVILAVCLAVAGLIGASPHGSFAQQGPMKDDIEQFAMDLHVGMERSTLTNQQKEQLRDDLKKLREARQNHDRIAAFRAVRNFRTILDSGAFKPEDQQRIKQDLQQIREVREDRSGPM